MTDLLPVGPPKRAPPASTSESPGCHDLLNRGRDLRTEDGALRYVAQAPRLSQSSGWLAEQAHGSTRRGQRSEDHAKQRGLSRAVRSDQRDELSGPDRDANVLQHPVLAVREGDPGGLQQPMPPAPATEGQEQSRAFSRVARLSSMREM